MLETPYDNTYIVNTIRKRRTCNDLWNKTDMISRQQHYEK